MMNSAKRQVRALEARVSELESIVDDLVSTVHPDDRPEPIAAAPTVPAKKAARRAAPDPDSGAAH